ncbi:amidohydrolase [Ancylobacter sp. Lp-2]|uniref:amidohydrolase n=1 Tax=Ancylobacter sp. Lp-2 TaxID=2881339 RepID=UPI001E3C8E2F|nr:amidohydrolase [Ancylobacter sp. Lp-2]MCB4771233.1 amidohydrolase [Ancylobacter sp. Lp-2]
MTEPAELILHNGDILTFDPTRPRVQALAVRGGRIVATGGDDLVAAFSGPATRRIDLQGRFAMPGFNDTHAHMEREGLKQQRLSLAGAGSVAEILRRIATATAAASPGDWIVTMPVGEPPYYFDGVTKLAEGRMPTREELDRAAPENPVYIPGHFGNWGVPPGHTALNSRAIALNGLSRHSCPRCRGIDFICDEVTGEPTGAIVERNGRPAVEFDMLRAVPRFGFEERLEGLRRSIELYHACGTTSVYEGHGSAPETISVYRALWERGELTMRTGLCVSPSWSGVGEAQRAMRDWLAYARGKGLGDPWLSISGVHVAYGGDKLVAELARADLPNTGWSGFVEQAYTPEEFREVCFLAAEHDLRLNTIVGDHLHEIVPVLQAINERHPLAGKRWVIQHIARARLEDLKALKALGVMVTTIPTYFLWKGGHAYLNEPDGGDLVVPHRHMLDLGLPLAIATDNIPYDPFFTLWVAMARQERVTGRQIGPGQALDVETALRLFTAAGAALTFDEGWKGPLMPGFAADIAVLSRNPLSLDAGEVRGLECLMTLVDGRIVHAQPF